MRNFVFGIFLVFFVINWALLSAVLLKHISFKALQFFFFPLINFPLTDQMNLFVSIFLSFFADVIYLFVVFLLTVSNCFSFFLPFSFLCPFLLHIFSFALTSCSYIFVLSQPDISDIFIFYLKLNLKKKYLLM